MTRSAMTLKYLTVLLLVCGTTGYQESRTAKANQRSYDQQLYEDVLDTQLCDEQLNYLLTNNLRYQFYDASFRIPSGLLTGNINDLGDYYQCLGIDYVAQNMEIQGKYCAISVPLQQDPIEWPNWPDWNVTLPELPDWNITWPIIPGLNETSPESESVMVADRFARMQRWAHQMAGIEEEPDTRIFPTLIATQLGATLAVCVPRVCTPRQAISFVQQRVAPFLNLTYNEFYCRLPGDKPFVAADYVAISIFSFISLLIVLSTAYDLMQIFYYKQKSSEISSLYRSFSVYTNTRRLLTFNTVPGALECVDGVRAISMMWVVVGHTYSFTLLGYIHNGSYILEWMTDFSSTWINAAPITVDTFFMLTGILIVYTTVGKISKARFLRSIHLFYLNRLLRMFPLLAAIVLLQASLVNHFSDGPFWMNVSNAAENCRTYWWSALLHIQNYVNPQSVCLPHSWYLSVDTQLYFLAPLVLWWLWSSPRVAWCALTGALLLSLVSSSIYSFKYNFSAALANMNRVQEFGDYVRTYYINTLTRAPPFFVGMIYGYMLHVYRDRKLRISKWNATVLWVISVLMMSFCVVSIYPVMQPDHTAQTFDNFLNAYMRGIWAVGLGWLIVACAKGYGGPVNWFLSLSVWKLPARLSYAMYLCHISIILVANGSWTKTHYFSSSEAFYRFMSDLLFTFVAAFVLCVTIDAPCSTLQKLLLGGKKRPQKPGLQPNGNGVNVVESDKYIKTTL